jgi:RNA polymerase-binding transcription factor DksA
MKDTHEFKAQLEAEKKTLMDELANVAIMNPADKNWEAVPPPVDVGEDSDENDMADRFQGYEERSATVKTLTARLTDVNDALTKIEKGTYGICEKSGEQIDIERLRANPAARTKIEFADQ